MDRRAIPREVGARPEGFPRASWDLPGLELRQVWSPAVSFDDAVLAQLPPGWRLLMFQDGSATRAMAVLSGQTIEAEIVEAAELREEPHAPPELALLPPPWLRRTVLLRTAAGAALSYALSWWNSASYAGFLKDPALPIGTSMARGRTEYCREVLSLFLARGGAIDRRFDAAGPFLGRHYVMYHGERPLNVIVEIYGPAVAALLDPTGFYPRWGEVR
ncbi:MAG: chorismate pyruvate-lyase family protein [Alphaproteobacteria bacterium]|nr:chorismate pyruvate-lyase family protein [Alphaproteobacteria bacterium]